MAVLDVNKLNQTGEDNFEQQTEYTDKFEVIVDDMDDRITALSTILNADDGDESIPQIGDAHPENDAAICYKRSAQQTDDNPFRWEVSVFYSTQKVDSPLNAVAQVRWDAREYKRPCTHEIAGNAIVNSAGLPPDPYPELDDADMTLVIVRNEASFSPTDLMDYRYTLSQNDFYGFTGIQCRMRPITAVRKTEPFQYYEVTYTIDFVSRKDEDGNEAGWTLRFLDAGLVEKVGGALRAITNGDGQPVSQPYPLDGTGAKLAVGSTAFNYLSYEVYFTKDWTPLNLEGV